MDTRLDGKRAAVTAGGVGRVIASRLAGEGADEIADIVVHLCSERDRHMSSQVIAVDGHTETLYPRTLI